MLETDILQFVVDPVFSLSTSLWLYTHESIGNRFDGWCTRAQMNGGTSPCAWYIANTHTDMSSERIQNTLCAKYWSGQCPCVCVCLCTCVCVCVCIVCVCVCVYVPECAKNITIIQCIGCNIFDNTWMAGHTQQYSCAPFWLEQKRHSQSKSQHVQAHHYETGMQPTFDTIVTTCGCAYNRIENLTHIRTRSRRWRKTSTLQTVHP